MPLPASDMQREVPLGVWSVDSLFLVAGGGRREDVAQLLPVAELDQGADQAAMEDAAAAKGQQVGQLEHVGVVAQDLQQAAKEEAETVNEEKYSSGEGVVHTFAISLPDHKHDVEVGNENQQEDVRRTFTIATDPHQRLPAGLRAEANPAMTEVQRAVDAILYALDQDAGGIVVRFFVEVPVAVFNFRSIRPAMLEAKCDGRVSGHVRRPLLHDQHRCLQPQPQAQGGRETGHGQEV